jgi:hypothetical protein
LDLEKISRYRKMLHRIYNKPTGLSFIAVKKRRLMYFLYKKEHEKEHETGLGFISSFNANLYNVKNMTPITIGNSVITTSPMTHHLHRNRKRGSYRKKDNKA